MLKRIFWAATITIPLYLLIAIEGSSTTGNVAPVTLQQPQHLLGYLKERLSEYKQGLQESPTPSVKVKLTEQ